MQKQDVNFLEEKSFSDLIGAPFYFIAQEFKPFMQAIIRIAGPWVAIALLAMAVFSNSAYSSFLLKADIQDSSFYYLVIFGIFILIGFLASVVTTQSYISLYVKKSKGNFTIEDVKDLVKKNVVKVFITGFLVYLLIIIGIMLLYIPGIYLSVALAFYSIILIHEEVSAGKSISRSFEIVKGNWWKTFGLIFIFGMIIGTASYVFIIPVYVVIISASISGTTIGAGSVIIIAISVALYFVAYVFFVALQQILISFQYFNLITQNEGASLIDRINEISKPKDENENKDNEESEIIEDEKISEQTSEKEDKESDEENRFLEDDDINRFKPKY